MSKKHHEWLEKFNGWPAATLGGAVLIVVAYLGFTTFRDLVEDRTLILADLDTARSENYQLMRIVDEREEVINTFQGQIQNIGETVGVLEKLSQTDEELLKKYSKVYFLNENYTPAKLTEIDKQYLYQGTTNFYIHTDVYPHLEKLIARAKSDEIELLIASAFRSFETQSALKSGYKVVYGSGANQFSADQGYSEHQLGTTVDFTTTKLGAAFTSFATDPGYKWLQANAHNYGFILSYPSGNAYYKFEPWHWRYVGVELATRLHDDDRSFYDMDQREIDEYLIKLFN